MRSTRRVALASAAALAFAPRAFAATDQAPLDALLAYQQAVVAAYDSVVAKAAAGRRGSLAALRRRARQPIAALRAAGAAAPAPAASAATLEQLIELEEALIAACYTALQNLSEERHLEATSAFMADAGRRVVVLRSLAGKPLLPRAFETGSA